ncbi:hypothetical protein EDD22DRAFT_1005720 [Suillus occidentalis]|nr:hypothetical protein EDD22DRAFT_1005720 [Suillus occidentalis]
MVHLSPWLFAGLYWQTDNTIQDSDARIKTKKREIGEHEANLEKEEKVLEGIHDGLKASSERDVLAKKATGLKDAVAQAEGQSAELQVEQEGKLSELNFLRMKKAEVQKKLGTCEEKFHAVQAGVQELRSKAVTLRQKAEEARASQAASTSQNRVLDSLKKLKQTGRIDGFHVWFRPLHPSDDSHLISQGCLGSLGTIPDKYNVAVSTACGAFNNMVVDTVAQGQACIEFLRKQNIGRTSFMVLEKLPTDKLNERVVTPEGVPWLFDLIKPQDPVSHLRSIKALGTPLLLRIWIKRTGFEQAARSLEAAQQELRDIEAEAERLTQAGPGIELDIKKLIMGVNNGKKQLADAERRVQGLKAQSKPNTRDLARIETLDAEIALSTEELEELQTKTGAIEAAIKALEKKIFEISGSKLLKQKFTVDGIRLLHLLANEELTRAQVMKATAEKIIVQYTSGVETNRTALEEVEQELEELKDQLAEVAQYLEDLEEKVEATQAAQEGSGDDLDQLKQQLQGKREKIDEFRKKELEITQKLTDKKKESAENERVLDHWRTEHDQFKLYEIDDDDEEEGSDQVAGASGSHEAVVKQEHADSVPPKKARQRTPSNEYTFIVPMNLHASRRGICSQILSILTKLKNTNPNLNVLKEYKKREEEFTKLRQDLKETTAARDAHNQLYYGLLKTTLGLNSWQNSKIFLLNDHSWGPPDFSRRYMTHRSVPEPIPPALHASLFLQSCNDDNSLMAVGFPPALLAQFAGARKMSLPTQNQVIRSYPILHEHDKMGDGYSRRKLSHGHPGPETSQTQSHAAALKSATPPAIGGGAPGAIVTGEQLKPISCQFTWMNSTHALLPGTKETEVIEEIARGIVDSGLELMMYHSEAAPGQYKVVTGPLPPLEAADALVHTRETITNIASKHGFRATFAPRLHADNSSISSSKSEPFISGYIRQSYHPSRKHLPSWCTQTPPSFLRIHVPPTGAKSCTASMFSESDHPILGVTNMKLWATNKNMKLWATNKDTYHAPLRSIPPLYCFVHYHSLNSLMEWRIFNTLTSSHLVTEYALLFAPAKTIPKTAVGARSKLAKAFCPMHADRHLMDNRMFPRIRQYVVDGESVTIELIDTLSPDNADHRTCTEKDLMNAYIKQGDGFLFIHSAENRKSLELAKENYGWVLGVQILVEDPNQVEEIWKRLLKLVRWQSEGAERRTLQRIAKATGGTLISSLANLEGDETYEASYLGSADEVVQERISDDKSILIKGTKRNDYMLDEMERALHDTLSIIKRTLESGAVVPGGGAVESALSIYLENFVTTLGSREQLAITEFAAALLSIPKQLAVNAAKDSTDLVAKLTHLWVIQKSASSCCGWCAGANYEYSPEFESPSQKQIHMAIKQRQPCVASLTMPVYLRITRNACKHAHANATGRFESHTFYAELYLVMDENNHDVPSSLCHSPGLLRSGSHLYPDGFYGYSNLAHISGGSCNMMSIWNDGNESASVKQGPPEEPPLAKALSGPTATGIGFFTPDITANTTLFRGHKNGPLSFSNGSSARSTLHHPVISPRPIAGGGITKHERGNAAVAPQRSMRLLSGTTTSKPAKIRMVPICMEGSQSSTSPTSNAQSPPFETSPAANTACTPAIIMGIGDRWAEFTMNDSNGMKEGNKLAEEMKLAFVQVSLKNRRNVEVFVHIARLIKKYQERKKHISSIHWAVLRSEDTTKCREGKEPVRTKSGSHSSPYTRLNCTPKGDPDAQWSHEPLRRPRKTQPIIIKTCRIVRYLPMASTPPEAGITEGFEWARIFQSEVTVTSRSF